MTPQDLKNSILQLAMQGKLVEQRVEEGTAKELYQQIQAEKAKLIKEGKIKKEKPLPEISENEIPFDIPESWKWMRLGDCISLLSGQDMTPDKYNDSENGIPYLTGASNIENKSIIINRWTEYPKAIARKGNLLVTCKGTIGKTCILRVEEKVHIARQIMAITEILIDIKFVESFLDYCVNELKRKAKSMIPGIERKDILEAIFPLPPIEEQKRIVDKLEKLLPLVEQYGKAYENLETFNVRFPEDMKKSILQYAMQGKLVEQRAEEGTAEELYRQIQQEKAELIKAGKIKKEKSLADITEDEIPFDIPESWKWVRVGSIFAHNTGKAMNSSAKKNAKKKGEIRAFITTSNVYWNSFDLTKLKEMFFSDDELERCTATKGDMLMCEGGAYFGRTAIWNLNYDIAFQNHIHRIRSYVKLEVLFFYYVFYFYRNTGMMQSQGTAMPGLSSVALDKMVIPLPPLEEQKRIVAKIEELLPYCERLAK